MKMSGLRSSYVILTRKPCGWLNCGWFQGQWVLMRQLYIKILGFGGWLWDKKWFYRVLLFQSFQKDRCLYSFIFLFKIYSRQFLESFQTTEHQQCALRVVWNRCRGTVGRIWFRTCMDFLGSFLNVLFTFVWEEQGEQVCERLVLWVVIRIIDILSQISLAEMLENIDVLCFYFDLSFSYATVFHYFIASFLHCLLYVHGLYNIVVRSWHCSRMKIEHCFLKFIVWMFCLFYPGHFCVRRQAQIFQILNIS